MLLWAIGIDGLWWASTHGACSWNVFWNGGGRRFKSHHGVFSYPKGIYTSISFWGGSLFEIYGSRFYFGVADTMVELHFPSVYEKKKYDGIEKLSDRQTFQISKASRNAWALLARMGDEEWLVVLHLLTFHPQISSVSAPADYTIHDSRMVIISRIIWPNYKIC